MTNDDERAAREWFRNYIRAGWMYPRADTGGHLLVIERLLNRKFPRGADVPDDGVVRMCDVAFPDGWGTIDKDNMRAAIDILHAHLTAPPPVKKVEVWTIRLKNGRFHGVYQTEEEAALVGNQFFFGSRIIKLVEAADE